MGFFDDDDSKEKELEGLEMDVEIADKRKELAEKKAVITQLKRQYGRDWKSVLGVNASSSLSTLKSFLRGAGQGLRAQSRTSLSMGSSGGVTKEMVLPRRDSAPSPLPNKDLRRL